MSLIFSGSPLLKWGKMDGSDGNGGTVKIDVLCLCVTIENTGTEAASTKLSFRGKIPDRGRPPLPAREVQFCDGVEVSLKAKERKTVCCCTHTRGLIEVANFEGWYVVSADDVDATASTEGTKARVPDPQH